MNGLEEVIRAYELNRMQVMPEHTLGDLQRYINDKIPPGSFLMAVLSNDLSGAYGRADDINIANMYAIVKYIYNDIPIASWGSAEKVKKWLEGV